MPITKCKICSKEFYVKPSHQKMGWGKYCSNKCKNKSQLLGEYFQCSICGKEIYRSLKLISRSQSKKYFCSKSCQTLWRNKEFSGEKSKNWKNGEQSYRNILKRNNIKPICSVCGITDERILNAHHKDHDRTNNNINNLVWLCLNCHFLAHHDKVFASKVDITW
ncbi:MAG TPA: HNH endonuclease [Candidatus Woesebacteria bacterium]|nr:HNH endonuclease [Candidatus Woesebacteria bacterium]HOY61209.1 HNH endonuclease [Candidatus Woesebacteria bacterium]HPR99593.1 HNH endonuclease [Candidatus Woesebacteria bacterium]